MKKDVLERIKSFINHSSLSKSAFASSIKMEQTTVNNQLLGKRSISIDLILSILEAYPDISSEWLLRGAGSMFKEENSYYPSALGEENDKYGVSVQKLKEKIISLEAENKVLRELVGLKEKEKKSEKIA